MKYKIILDGCDDETEFEVELNEKELELIKKIASLSRENSRYSCQPTLIVEDSYIRSTR